MCKKVLVRKQALCFIALILVSYISTLLFAMVLKPAPLGNALGFFALVAYIATLIPSIFKTVFPENRGNKVIAWILRKRRYIGITAFGLSLDHVLITTVKKGLNFQDLHTYIEYLQGTTLLIIFTLLAITSNDWSVRKFKSNWKKLHQLTYLAVFLLPWHIIDKMSYHWSYLTPLGILLSVSTVFLFSKRRWLELVNLKRKQQVSKVKVKPLKK